METKQPFETVIADHGATVWRVCRAVVGAHDADDAWSETFLSALRAYPDLPANANIEAWLVTIAHRKAIDVTRLQRRSAAPVAHVPEGDVSPPTDERPWDAVQQLPDKQRKAVAYHYLGGLPFAEVAALLGGSAEAARKAASDGIRALRTAMTKEDAEEQQ